jgi:hypothetical protein
VKCRRFGWLIAITNLPKADFLSNLVCHGSILSGYRDSVHIIRHNMTHVKILVPFLTKPASFESDPTRRPESLSTLIMY